MEHDTEVDIADRVAIVTGGNSGIGREAALQLARMGMSVFIFSNVEKKRY